MDKEQAAIQAAYGVGIPSLIFQIGERLFRTALGFGDQRAIVILARGDIETPDRPLPNSEMMNRPPNGWIVAVHKSARPKTLAALQALLAALDEEDQE